MIISGGIVGYSEGKIYNSANYARIEVDGSRAGGIVGEHSEGPIENCYCNGNIINPSGDTIGKIAGLSFSTDGIKECYYDPKYSEIAGKTAARVGCGQPKRNLPGTISTANMEPDKIVEKLNSNLMDGWKTFVASLFLNIFLT